MAERVLVVDDDELERRRVVAEFARAGMVVAEASNAVEGLIGVLEEAPEVIVLSEEIPPLAADDVVSVLRRLSDAPLIILGSGQDPEEVSALDRGADAYLRRPLSSAMLLARARALLRRYRRSSSMSASRIRASGLAEMLTGTEKRLLLCLASNGSGLISQGELLTRVWGGDGSPDVAKFYLRRLRNKLEKAACGLRLVSVRGVGHRLVQAEMERASFRLGAYRRRAM
ncbi:MAG: hypothetical protein AMS16_06770 [Planctomycetes bacterium DG_58]|nr:MAG: hypothetical protein AMS16_06770 [Planctomycetes bacterium DG_58]